MAKNQRTCQKLNCWVNSSPAKRPLKGTTFLATYRQACWHKLTLCGGLPGAFQPATRTTYPLTVRPLHPSLGHGYLWCHLGQC